MPSISLAPLSDRYLSFAEREEIAILKAQGAGVPVNAVTPGPVHTGGTATERIEALGTTTLLNRAASPEEIAEVIAFLASPRSNYVTGATVAADGGRTAI